MEYTNFWDVVLSYKAGLYGTIIFGSILIILISLSIFLNKKFRNKSLCFFPFEIIIGIFLSISLLFFINNGLDVYRVKKYVSNLKVDKNTFESNFANIYTALDKVNSFETDGDSILIKHKSGQHLFQNKSKIKMNNIILDKINSPLQEVKEVVNSNVVFRIPKLPTKHIVPAPCLTNLKNNQEPITFKNELIKMIPGIYINIETLELYNIIQSDTDKYVNF